MNNQTDTQNTYPPLPEPLTRVAQFCGEWRETSISASAQPVFTEAQMRAYVDADRTLRAGQATEPDAHIHLFRKTGGGRHYEQANLGGPNQNPDPEDGFEWHGSKPLYLRASPPVEVGVTVEAIPFGWVYQHPDREDEPVFSFTRIDHPRFAKWKETDVHLSTPSPLPAPIEPTEVFELRFIGPKGTTTRPPILQVRYLIDFDSGDWLPWSRIPFVVVSNEEFKAADKPGLTP